MHAGTIMGGGSSSGGSDSGSGRLTGALEGGSRSNGGLHGNSPVIFTGDCFKSNEFFVTLFCLPVVPIASYLDI